MLIVDNDVEDVAILSVVDLFAKFIKVPFPKHVIVVGVLKSVTVEFAKSNEELLSVKFPLIVVVPLEFPIIRFPEQLENAVTFVGVDNNVKLLLGEFKTFPKKLIDDDDFPNNKVDKLENNVTDVGVENNVIELFDVSSDVIDILPLIIVFPDTFPIVKLLGADNNVKELLGEFKILPKKLNVEDVLPNDNVDKLENNVADVGVENNVIELFDVSSDVIEMLPLIIVFPDTFPIVKLLGVDNNVKLLLGEFKTFPKKLIVEDVLPNNKVDKLENNVTLVGVENNVTVVNIVSIAFNFMVPFITTFPLVFPNTKFDVQFEPIVKDVGVDNNENVDEVVSKLLPKNEIIEDANPNIILLFDKLNICSLLPLPSVVLNNIPELSCVVLKTVFVDNVVMLNMVLIPVIFVICS